MTDWPGAPATCFILPNDSRAAMFAGRRQGMDRAFETVEGVGGTVHADLKCLVVVVSTGFTSRHDNPRKWLWFWGLAVITPRRRAGSGRFCVPMAALLPAIRADCGILAGKWRENPPASMNLSLRRRD